MADLMPFGILFQFTFFIFMALVPKEIFEVLTFYLLPRQKQSLPVNHSFFGGTNIVFKNIASISCYDFNGGIKKTTKPRKKKLCLVLRSKT